METPRNDSTENRRRTRTVVFLSLVLLWLAACGQKGPLFLPGEAAPEAAAPAAADSDEAAEDEADDGSRP